MPFVYSCEGLAIQPFLTEKYFALFAMLGHNFGKMRIIDETLLAKRARPEHLSAENLVQVIPFINRALWDAQIEKNGILNRIFDRLSLIIIRKSKLLERMSWGGTEIPYLEIMPSISR